MKESWKSIGLWLGLIASSIAIWEKFVPLITFPSPLFEAFLYAVVVGFITWTAWKFCVSVCQGVPTVYQWFYSRTKRGRFAALQRPVESMMRELPRRDELWVKFPIANQQRLRALLAKLDQLGIAPPIKAPQGPARSDESILEYCEALRKYLGDVYEYILRHDFKGCIEMSRSYRQPPTA